MGWDGRTEERKDGGTGRNGMRGTDRRTDGDVGRKGRIDRGAGADGRTEGWRGGREGGVMVDMDTNREELGGSIML